MFISSRVPPWDSMRFEARRTDWHLLLLGRHRSPGSRGVEGCATKACSTEEHWTLNKITSDHIGPLDITMKFVFPSDMCRTSFLNVKYRSRFSCGWRPGNANGFGWSIVLTAYVLRRIDAMSCKFPHFRRENSRSLSNAFCKSTCLSWPFVSMSFVHLCSFSSLAQPLQFRNHWCQGLEKIRRLKGSMTWFQQDFLPVFMPFVGMCRDYRLCGVGEVWNFLRGLPRRRSVRGFVLPHFVGALILVNTVRQCGIQLGCMYCIYLSCTSPWSTSCVFSEVSDSFVNTWWRERPERIWPIYKLMHFNRVVGLSWYSVLGTLAFFLVGDLQVKGELLWRMYQCSSLGGGLSRLRVQESVDLCSAKLVYLPGFGGHFLYELWKESTNALFSFPYFPVLSSIDKIFSHKWPHIRTYNY